MATQGGVGETWRDLVRVRPRYRRSVHLERDADEQGALEGYVLTPLVRTLTGRIVEGYRSSARSWSITGPYGTGKSAFALFLANVFSPPELDASRTARRMLDAADPSFAGALSGPTGLFEPRGGLFPVLATGERRPLDQVLLHALHKLMGQLWSVPGRTPAVVGRVAALAEAADSGRGVPASEVVQLFEETAVAAAEPGQRGHGLIVVLDEAGKVLEDAARHPGRGDIQLLQELAEAANRSAEHPIMLAVVLHQAFEQYAAHLGLTERGAWAEAQGRFEDLAFQEVSHDLLQLVGEALERAPFPEKLRRSLAPTATRCAALVTRGGHQDSKKRQALLLSAFPLHPVTSLLLSPLFRSRLAQNERSLFAFLTSAEPFGLQEHLDRPQFQDGQPALLLPDSLYDYAVASLGDRFHGPASAQWAQIETALQRLPEGAGALDARVVKTVGLLGLFGDAAGVVASEATLEAIYTDGGDASKEALAETIERLRRASLVLFRRLRNAYQLWEGSDLDVDARVHEALGRVDAASQLVQRVARVAPPRPVIARRHLFETGTLRYFDLRYVDASVFEDGIPSVDLAADGSLLVVIAPDAAARERLVHALQHPLTWATAGPRPLLVAVPGHVDRLLELGAEIAALEWMEMHTPGLHEDLAARREVTARVAEAERQLRAEVARLLGGEVPCAWLTRDGQHPVTSAHALARLVSELCDSTYSKAPHIHNELLNRRQLSSASAGARRALLEAMVTHAGEAGLGIEGTPPERSMYRSLLEHHGLHRERDGGWGFGPPVEVERGSLVPVWLEMDRALRDTGETRLRVSALFERLREPPYGLKDGVLPVLLVAAMMACRDETALYEDGVFVPAPTGAVLERLLRGADRFEVQRLSVAGPRAALHERMADMLLPGAKGSSSGVMPIARQLVRVVRHLTGFVRATKTVSPKAQAVREALLRAREPASLLFDDLPVACGLPPLGASGAEEQAEAFVEELRAAIRELQEAYPKLLDAIEDALRTGLCLPADPAELRRELVGRALRLLPAAVDPQLKAFLIRATIADVPRREWLVSVGTLLGGKPPESWNDRDIEQMCRELGSICQRFASLEAMTVRADTTPVPVDPALIRVAITQPGRMEEERVLAFRPADEAFVNDLVRQLRALTGETTAARGEAAAFALALMTREAIAALDSCGESSAERSTHVHS